jgi:hypothetical protein
MAGYVPAAPGLRITGPPGGARPPQTHAGRPATRWFDVKARRPPGHAGQRRTSPPRPQNRRTVPRKLRRIRAPGAHASTRPCDVHARRPARPFLARAVGLESRRRQLLRAIDPTEWPLSQPRPGCEGRHGQSVRSGARKRRSESSAAHRPDRLREGRTIGKVESEVGDRELVQQVPRHETSEHRVVWGCR